MANGGLVMLDTLLPRALAVHGGVARSLAGAIGVPEATISKWRSGKLTPSLPSLIKLAKVTGDDLGEVCIEYGSARRAVS
jgi:transcriptional regulator with XRE-family HTH domain